MKVVTTIIVDVDVFKYRSEYNDFEATAADIRDDIKARTLDAAIIGLHVSLFDFIKSVEAKD